MTDIIDIDHRLTQYVHIWAFQDMGLILMTSWISIYGHKRDKDGLVSTARIGNDRYRDICKCDSPQGNHTCIFLVPFSNLSTWVNLIEKDMLFDCSHRRVLASHLTFLDLAGRRRPEHLQGGDREGSV